MNRTYIRADAPVDFVRKGCNTRTTRAGPRCSFFYLRLRVVINSGKAVVFDD